jgi:hypothetical protein
MVNDESINPYAFDWNAVLLRYCDGASWIGNMKDPVSYKNQDLWFRGKSNLEAVFASLVKHHGLGDATEVLIGGDSAGGLATFLHIDTMADLIHSANDQASVPKARVSTTLGLFFGLFCFFVFFLVSSLVFYNFVHYCFFNLLLV